MLNQSVFKIIVNRNYLKCKDSSSPKVKVSLSANQVDKNEYYQPIVELIYRIISERRCCSNE